jgi:hypothetical protein
MGKDATEKTAGRKPSGEDFREAWKESFRETALFAASADCQRFGLFSAHGKLTQIDHTGKTLYSVTIEETGKSLSLANTGEFLLVNDSGHCLLIDSQGRVIWKKRPFHALTGVISSSGTYFGFISKEPAIILSDKDFRVKWTYRNILHVPATLAISAAGQTIAFTCRDERGNQGITTIAQTGKPHPPFYGGGSALSLALNTDGSKYYLLDRHRGLFAIQSLFARQEKRAELPADFHSISLAEETGQILAASQEGVLGLFDHQFQFLWQTILPTPAVHTGISSDGKRIVVFDAKGDLAVFQHQSTVAQSRKEFQEIELSSQTPDRKGFKKAWSIEFAPPAPGNAPLASRFTIADGTECLLLWDGQEYLSCLSEHGEELWKNRLAGDHIKYLGTSATVDLVLALSRERVIGTKLDGRETFKFFGSFTGVHLFSSGTFALVSEQAEVMFFSKPKQMVLKLEFPWDTYRIAGMRESFFLIGGSHISLIGETGEILVDLPLAGKLLYSSVDLQGNFLLYGLEGGEIGIIDSLGRQTAIHREWPPFVLASYHRAKQLLLAAGPAETSLAALFFQTLERGRLLLHGIPRQLISRKKRFVVATSVDELSLIDLNGVLLSRYTFPDRILQFLPGQAENTLYALAEGSLSKLTEEVE